MYCPKCGTQNTETNKYCRACGEDLHLVSQVLKKHIPVVIASKIDSVLDRRVERFRRNSFLFLVMACGLLASGLTGVQGKPGMLDSLFIPFGVCSLLFSLWEYLAYKHSLSLGREFERDVPLPPGERSFTDNTILKLDLNEQTQVIDTEAVPPTKESTRSARFLHCPACGAPSSNHGKYCQQCGENLAVIYKAMRKSPLRSTLDSWLGKYVKSQVKQAQRAEASGQAGKLMLSLGALYLLMGSGTWLMEQHFDTLRFTLGIVFSVIGLWDYLVYRRKQFTGSKIDVADSLTDTTASHAEPQTPTTNILPEPSSSVTEVTTRKLEDRIKEKR